MTDGVAVLYMSRIMNTVYADLSTTDLEFASPYHGLAELYASGTINASHIDPILNLPRLVTQVSSEHPNQPGPPGAHDYWHPSFGTLSPHERRLRVAPGVRTVAQFRALDFGMERCELVLRLPGPGDPVESKERPQFSERTVLDVYMLDAPRPLDAWKVTWDARPPRRAGERVMTIAPRLGEETRVGQFPCVWGSLHTFEVACAESAGSGCLVDVWSSQNTTYGECAARLGDAVWM